MCSKKWAKPDLPGSTSLREPVCTGICRETMLGNPVGTTITTRPFGSVLSVTARGRTSAGDEEAARATLIEPDARRGRASRRARRMGVLS